MGKLDKELSEISDEMKISKGFFNYIISSLEKRIEELEKKENFQRNAFDEFHANGGNKE